MNKKFNALQQDIIKLTEQLKATQAELDLYKEKYSQSMRAYAQLIEAFKQSQRRQFGSRSERFLDKSPQQMDMLSDVLPWVPEETASDTLTNPDNDESNLQAQTNTKPAPKKPRTKDNSHFAKNLPRREVIVPAEKLNGDSRFVRYEITELLHYEPPVYEVIVQKREVLVIKDKETNISTITIAPNPKRLLPKAKVTESFLAQMIVGKLYDRQPLYHLEKKYGERFDFKCPRNKLARWFIESATQMQPLVNLLQDTILGYDVTFCDPTHLQVLDEPGRLPTTKSYVFTIKGGPPDKMSVMYQYNSEEHKSFLMEWFMDYKGYLHVDGQNIFDVFDKNPDIALVFCNAHARRKYEPIDKAGQKPGLATDAMRFYRKLYAIEREAKNEKLSPTARYQLRQEKSKPLINGFEKWIEEKIPLVLPQSPLGKAMDYVKKRTDGLRRFLDDGRLEIDTNGLEQKNKDLALSRNNFLFAQSVEGAKALCIHMSLVVTAVMHGHDPYHYYVQAMQQLPYCTTVEDIEKLLPWNIAPKKKKIVETSCSAA